MNPKSVKTISLFVVLVLLVAAVGGGVVYALNTNPQIGGLSVASAPALQPGVADGANEGILVANVVPGGPAATAGLVRGDIILAINDQTVNNHPALIKILNTLDLEADTAIAIQVLHGDETRTLTLAPDKNGDYPFLGIMPCGDMMPGNHTVIWQGQSGAMITDIVADSPAEKAGLTQGERIMKVDDQDLGPENGLTEIIATYQPGDTIRLTVKRPGEEVREVEVTLERHPEKEGVAYLGIAYMPGMPAVRAMPAMPGMPDVHFFGKHPGQSSFMHPDGLNVQGSVIQDVTADSPATTAGLKKGEIITALNGEPLNNPRDLSQKVAEYAPGDTITLSVTPNADEAVREVEVILGAHPDDATKGYLGVKVGGYYKLHMSGDATIDGMPHDMFLDETFEWFGDDEAPHFPHQQHHIEIMPGMPMPGGDVEEFIEEVIEVRPDDML